MAYFSHFPSFTHKNNKSKLDIGHLQEPGDETDNLLVDLLNAIQLVEGADIAVDEMMLIVVLLEIGCLIFW